MDYLFFMHEDAHTGSDAIGDDAWEQYICAFGRPTSTRPKRC